MSPSWVWFSHLWKESLTLVPWWSAWSPVTQLLPESSHTIQLLRLNVTLKPEYGLSTVDWQRKVWWVYRLLIFVIFDILPNLNLNNSQLLLGMNPWESAVGTLRIHDIDEVSSLNDILEKMDEVIEVRNLGIYRWLWQLFERNLDVIPELGPWQEFPNSCPESWMLVSVTFDLIFFRDHAASWLHLWLTFPVTPKRPNRLFMSFCGNSSHHDLTWLFGLDDPTQELDWVIWSEVLHMLEVEGLLNILNELSVLHELLLQLRAMTKSSTYAMTMRLRWPEESKLVKVQGSDFICERLRLLRTWFKWTGHDLGECLRP